MGLFRPLGRVSRLARDVEKVTTLINPAACLHWNLDKHYLLDLQNAGVPVVPSVIHHSHEALSWDEARQGFTSDDLVIKPTVSGAAKDTYRVTRETTRGISHLPTLNPPKTFGPRCSNART